MKKAKRILALLLIFGMLFGVGGIAAFAEVCDVCGEEPCVCEEDTGGDTDTEEALELTDFFKAFLKWLGDNFGQDIADVMTKIITKVGLAFAKIGLKFIVRTVITKSIVESLPF